MRVMGCSLSPNFRSNSHPHWEQTLGQTLTWGTRAALLKSVHCRFMRNLPRNFTLGLVWLFQGLQLQLQFIFTLQTFILKNKPQNISFIFPCFNVSVSDIFLLPRCDILTWAYEGRNSEKGIDFCKSFDSKGAENKPLKIFEEFYCWGTKYWKNWLFFTQEEKKWVSGFDIYKIMETMSLAFPFPSLFPNIWTLK